MNVQWGALSYDDSWDFLGDQDGSLSDRKGVLPWPSVGWQQAALAGAVVLGLIVATAGIVAAIGQADLAGAVVTALIGFSITGVALYAGWSTRWLNATSQATSPTIAAGVLTVGLVIVLAAAAYVVAKVIFYGLILDSFMSFGTDWGGG